MLNWSADRIMLPVKGFLIIELLVAMAIMSIVIGTIAGYQWATISAQQDAKRHLQAVTIASSKLEAVLAQKHLSVTPTEECDDFIVTWHVQTSQLPKIEQLSQPIIGKKPLFATIAVSVQWHSVRQALRSVTLTAGMPLYEKEEKA